MEHRVIGQQIGQQRGIAAVLHIGVPFGEAAPIAVSVGERVLLRLGLTLFYIAHVYYCLVRRVLDRELMLSFTALSAFFLAITIPLLLSAAALISD